MSKVIFISILIIFTGCVQKEVVYMDNSNSSYSKKKNTTSSHHKKTYKTTYSKYKKNHISKHSTVKHHIIKKDTNKNIHNKCETAITKVFNSKASGRIIICKGKILTDGQKSKIIYVNK